MKSALLFCLLAVSLFACVQSQYSQCETTADCRPGHYCVGMFFKSCIRYLEEGDMCLWFFGPQCSPELVCEMFICEPRNGTATTTTTPQA
ncbi:hypothetical protein JTE90_001118 [Oedothorax gibbosus]|uniref:Uncharacterized protein n=1 Tax=Oedothorax gibbosus TaxID=931172 RepID=A0AAV6VGZ9_9ARAC|nr:hypothetical protein JTE90_001118 [Oedothorax gibbosus]